MTGLLYLVLSPSLSLSLSSVQKNALLLDSSTIEAATARQVAASAEKLGASYMDAPVSGGEGSQTGTRYQSETGLCV